MNVDELRELEVDELDGRLKAARRELYELRFKHAVGQLENSSQISKVRHDIARIMTVLRERDFGVLATPHEGGAVSSAVKVVEEEAGAAEAEADAPTAVATKPKRTRKAKSEDAAE